MVTVQNMAFYIVIDDPDLQTPSTDRYHPVDAHRPIIVSTDHLSTVDRWVTYAQNCHVTGQLPISDASGRNYPINPPPRAGLSVNHQQMVDRWLINRSRLHMDFGGQHDKSVDWSVNRQQMVLAEKKAFHSW